MATMETTPVHGHAVLTAYQTHGTPASAPVVIKLGYTVMHILERSSRGGTARPTTSFSSLGDFSTKHLAAGRSRPFFSHRRRLWL
ncbi:unnamed protein product [Musa acuminata subsp. burmannicoides]